MVFFKNLLWGDAHHILLFEHRFYCHEFFLAPWPYNHLDELLWWANQKRSYFWHSLLQQVQRVVAPFTSHGKLYKCAPPNHFPKPNRHILTCLHPILLCRITYWAPLEMLPPISTELSPKYLNVFWDSCKPVRFFEVSLKICLFLPLRSKLVNSVKVVFA